ncbi:hypothetical protein [Nocardia wallacei]|uniref:hypothetical protein n=1 Tax=Nocardia wallacei TaxID=480035 RepID=UPI002457D591|nr:hypothetical protein [Nocardia wallacei]
MNAAESVRRVAGAVVVAGVAVVGVACSQPAPDYGERGDTGFGVPSGAVVQTMPPLPAPWDTLDRNDPSAVAVAAIQAVFDWHPERGEVGPEIAARRAAPLLTPRAADTYRPYPIPRPTWQAWMDSSTSITATTGIGAEQHPPDTDVRWQRKAVTTLTVATPGKPTTSSTVISVVTVQRQPVWTVTHISHLVS